MICRRVISRMTYSTRSHDPLTTVRRFWEAHVSGAEARWRLLAEKIDVTQWMVDYFQERFGRAAAHQAH